MNMESYNLRVQIAELPFQSIIRSHTRKLHHRYALTSLVAFYLFINYPSPPMCVVLSLSERSSCNCFSLKESEAAQRNRIETTFAFRMSWDWEEGGSTALLPYTKHHHLRCLPVLPSLLLSSIVSLSSPYLLPPPPPHPHFFFFFHSMAPLALSFQRVPRSTGACSSEQGIVQFSAGVDKLICSRGCVCVILHGCVRTCPEASISKPLRVEICVCVCARVCVLQLF